MSLPECDSVDATDHIVKLQACLNELDQHALLEIVSQFMHNALDWHLRHMQKFGKRQRLKPGDLLLELDTTPGSLRAKARGPYLVKAVKPNGTVVLTSGETVFKDRVDFERHIGSLYPGLSSHVIHYNCTPGVVISGFQALSPTQASSQLPTG